MDPSTKIGMNRTGLQMSPLHSKALLETVDDTPAEQPGGEDALANVRRDYIMESEGLGTVPAPGSVKGIVKSTMEMITGDRPQVFLDKLAERLAYERGGVRLYDGIIAKFLARADEHKNVSAGALLQIREEEARHFQMLTECIEMMGADPTAQTPSADLVGVETMGFMQAISDPRTSFVQCLHAALAVELADVAGWDLLAVLAEGIGQDEMAKRFRQALENEESHLLQVRTWYQTLLTENAKIG